MFVQSSLVLGAWLGLLTRMPHIALVWPAAAAKSHQSCLTLCDPIDGSPPGSPVPGILQARTLEWVAISFSNAWKWKVKVKSLSRAWLLATPWTAAYQAPPSMGFSRQEYWSGVPLPSLCVACTSLKCRGWVQRASIPLPPRPQRERVRWMHTVWWPNLRNNSVSLLLHPSGWGHYKDAPRSNGSVSTSPHKMNKWDAHINTYIHEHMHIYTHYIHVYVCVIVFEKYDQLRCISLNSWFQFMYQWVGVCM